MPANIGFSQNVLKKLTGIKKQIPVKPLVAGAALAGGAHVAKAGLNQADSYESGFYPGYGSSQG